MTKHKIEDHPDMKLSRLIEAAALEAGLHCVRVGRRFYQDDREEWWMEDTIGATWKVTPLGNGRYNFAKYSEPRKAVEAAERKVIEAAKAWEAAMEFMPIVNACDGPLLDAVEALREAEKA